MRDNRIIGHRDCLNCDKWFGYTEYTKHRQLCRDCTYAAEKANIQELRDSDGPDDTLGYPGYIIAVLRETNDHWYAREKNGKKEDRIIPDYEKGVKRGLIGTHKQLGAL
jgi:hypothetical protein